MIYTRTGRSYFPYNPRHFVPGYYHAVPLGQNTPERRGFTKLALMGRNPEILQPLLRDEKHPNQPLS
jgi:hypothetical protein